MTFTIVLTILWLAVAFAALRVLGKRYFHEPNRADVAAAAIVVAVIVGIAIDPVRIFDRSARADAPAAVQAVAPAAPADQSAAGGNAAPSIEAVFTTEFAAWQRGALGPANYTTRGYAASLVQVKALSPGLRGLGAVRRTKLISSNPKDGLVGYEYRFDCAHGSELMGAYVDASGKIDSVGFQSAPALK